MLFGRRERGIFPCRIACTFLSVTCSMCSIECFFVAARIASPSLIILDIAGRNLELYHVSYRSALSFDRIVTEQGETRIMFSISGRELHPLLLRLHNKRCITR
ncbi:MAG: hypothetical protein D3925_03190 [Candidatus Electrothrix sp. AR5]|nr:hypothetical protein [Candidatus Electrothrix sp. AR5]